MRPLARRGRDGLGGLQKSEQGQRGFSHPSSAVRAVHIQVLLNPRRFRLPHRAEQEKLVGIF